MLGTRYRHSGSSFTLVSIVCWQDITEANVLWLIQQIARIVRIKIDEESLNVLFVLFFIKNDV